MGIIQLLTSIHSYSLNLSERIAQTNNNNNNINTGDNVTNNNETIGNTMISRICNNNNTVLNIESCTVCPVAEVAALVRLSFDSMHRNAICELGMF